jgi:hypothetical protein
MLLNIWGFCIWGFACGFILFCQSYCPWLSKICNFQFVLHVAQKVFDLGSLNFTGMLISMWSCAPVVLHVNLFCFVSVIALDLVKICIFQFVSCLQKVFNLESWNLIGMLLSMCSCAPWVSLVDLFSISRVIALDLVKIVQLCCVICSLTACVRINQNYTEMMISITVNLCT